MSRSTSRFPRVLFVLSLAAVWAAIGLWAGPAQAATQTWSVGTGNWDTTTANWTGVTWTNGNDAVFGGTFGSTITISEAGIRANKLTFNVDGDTIAGTVTNNLELGSGNDIYVNAATATISAPITGTAGLEKYGTGTLILSGANTYSGNTQVKAGTLQSGANDVLSDAAGTIVMDDTGTLDLNGFSDTIGVGTVGGDNSIFFAANSAAQTMTIQTGAGTLTLGGNIRADSNAYGTKIISGNLSLGNADRTYGQAANRQYLLDITANISDDGGGRKLTLTEGYLGLSGANTYTGGTTLNNGVLDVGGGNVGSVGAITSSPLGTGALVFNGGRISSDGTTPREILNAVSFTQNGIIGDATRNGKLTFSAGIDLGSSSRSITLNSNVDFDGVITNGRFNKNGEGTLTLNNTGNSYTGIAGVSAGVLRSGASDVVPDGSAILIGGTGTFDLNGFSDTVNGDGTRAIFLGVGSAGQLATLSTGTGTLTIGGNVTSDSNAWGDKLISGNLNLGSATRTFNLGVGSNLPTTLTISADISGGTGAGITMTNSTNTELVLSGTNTYDGPTTINSGTLQFNQAASIGGTGRTVVIGSNGVAATAYAIDNAFLQRIDNASTGAVAMAADSSNDLDFNSATGAELTSASLGVVSGTRTYSGTLTPNGTTYRLGGGGGTLVMDSVLTGANSLEVKGNVNLAAANDYTGTTTLTSGSANLAGAENAGTSGPLGNPATPAGSIIFNGGALQYSAVNQYDYSSRFATINNQPYNIDTNGQTVTLATALAASGSSGMTKDGTGTLTLSKDNTYTGTTTINGGMLVLTGDNSGATGTTTVNSGATLRVGEANNAPTGTMSLRGTLELLNDSSTDYTVPSRIDVNSGNGTIHVGQAIGGSGANNTHTVSRADVNNSYTLSITGDSGYHLTIDTFNRGNNNNYVDAYTDLTINQFNGGKTRLNAKAGDITVMNAYINEWVDKNDSGTMIVPAAGIITCDGNGRLTIQKGLLVFNGTMASTGTQRLTVNNSTITGTGTINSPVYIDGSGSINLVDGVVKTNLVLGNTLTFNNSTKKNIVFDLGAGAAGTDMITVDGSTTVTNAGAAVINLSQIGGIATPSTPGTYTLIDTVGAGTMGPVTDFALASKAFGQTFELSVVANDLLVTTAAGTPGPAAAFWKGGASNWSTDTNWNTDATSETGTGASPGYETNVTFYTTTPAAGNLSNTVDVDFDINSLNYSAAATNNTTINNANKALVIEATSANGNTVGSGITVATPNSGSPVHQISTNVGIAADQTWTIDSGARLQINREITDFGAGRTLTKAGDGTLTLNYAKPSTFPVLAITAGIVDIANQNTYPGTGTASQMILNGGALRFNDQPSGLFTLGANGGALEYYGGTAERDTWFGSGFLGATGAGARTLTLVGPAAKLGSQTTFQPGIVDPATGTTALTVESGSWALTGANTYTGLTTVTSGLLSIRTQQAINGGTAAFTPANITVESGASLVVGIGDAPTYFDNDAIATILDASHLGGSTATTGLKSGAQFGIDTSSGGGGGGQGGTFTYSNVIADLSGGNVLHFIKNGTGTLILDQANTYTGTTTVTGQANQSYSILKAGHAEAFGPASTASLLFADRQGQERNIVALNGFDITVVGLNGTGGNDGGPQPDPALPTSFGNFVCNTAATDATLTVNTTIDSNFGGSLRDGGTGSLGLTKDGPAALTLNPGNRFISYSGQLTIKNGTLATNQLNNVSADGALGNSTLAVIMGDTGTTGALRYTGNTTSSTKPFTMADGGTGAFQVDNSGTTLTLNGPIDGDGGLTKEGAGTLALVGSTDYTGDTIVSEGTLIVSNAGAGLDDLASVMIEVGATMDLDFSGFDTIGELWLGGIQMGVGDYNSSTASAYFSNNGTLRVSLLAGDANGDGVVNAADYIVLKTNMGQPSGAALAEGDLDGDGDVDWDDLQILQAHYGESSLGAPGAIPEPATLSLLALGGPALIRRKKK